MKLHLNFFASNYYLLAVDFALKLLTIMFPNYSVNSMQLLIVLHMLTNSFSIANFPNFIFSNPQHTINFKRPVN